MEARDVQPPSLPLLKNLNSKSICRAKPIEIESMDYWDLHVGPVRGGGAPDSGRTWPVTRPACCADPARGGVSQHQRRCLRERRRGMPTAGRHDRPALGGSGVQCSEPWFPSLQDLVNIEMFLTAKEVEESLERRETATCLAWCHDNKSRLRKMKVHGLRRGGAPGRGGAAQGRGSWRGGAAPGRAPGGGRACLGRACRVGRAAPPAPEPVSELCGFITGGLLGLVWVWGFYIRGWCWVLGEILKRALFVLWFEQMLSEVLKARGVDHACAAGDWSRVGPAPTHPLTDSGRHPARSGCPPVRVQSSRLGFSGIQLLLRPRSSLKNRHLNINCRI